MKIHFAMKILEHIYSCADSVNQKYLKEKYNHSFLTLCVGFRIANSSLKQELQCALLLHDIGRFLSQNAADHAETGYQFLKKIGFTSTELLLPVRYHENDTNWREKLKCDGAYVPLTEDEKSMVTYACALVRDADIISNMFMTLSKSRNENIILVSDELKEAFFHQEIPASSAPDSVGDQIMYMLCGLPLITLEESFSYIKKTGIAHNLAAKVHSPEIVRQLHDLYHF